MIYIVGFKINLSNILGMAHILWLRMPVRNQSLVWIEFIPEAESLVIKHRILFEFYISSAVCSVAFIACDFVGSSIDLVSHAACCEAPS